jgi:hypothetical protein
MRISIANREQGSTLFVTLMTCLLIGIVLASYLDLISSRYKIAIRSQCWNAAVPVAEQGVEEAMAHLVDDSNNPTANNWAQTTISGQTAYAKQRTNSDGSYFLANLYFTGSNNPYIYSTGFVPSPLNPANFISRTVKVTVTNEGVFRYAIVAINAIQMNGTGMASDSYNSMLTNLSSNMQYDPTKTSTNGDIASVNGPVNFGNHHISGNLSLGPDVTSSSVGSGQVSGQIYTDFNVAFPDATLPQTTWIPATTGNVSGVNSYYFTTSGDYYLSGSLPIVVAPGVTVRIREDSASFNPGGIHVMATNGISGTLSLYQTSGQMTLNGNLTVDSGVPINFQYYGMSGVKSVKFAGNSVFVGVVYSPEAAMTLTGSGSQNHFMGALVVKSITLNGHYAFHYDESLNLHGPSRGYVPSFWAEL